MSWIPKLTAANTYQNTLEPKFQTKYHNIEDMGQQTNNLILLSGILKKLYLKMNLSLKLLRRLRWFTRKGNGCYGNEFVYKQTVAMVTDFIINKIRNKFKKEEL